MLSDIMVIEDDLDYMDTLSDQSLQNQTLWVLGNQTNQSVEDVPCLCASSTVINYISLNYHQRHHQQYQQQNVSYLNQVVPFTELCLEGIAIPVLGGAGILGNVAAVVVLRFFFAHYCHHYPNRRP